MVFPKTQHGWRLLQHSWEVVRDQKKLLVFSLIGRSVFFVMLCVTIALGWMIRHEIIDVQQFSTQQLWISYLFILLGFLFANIISLYFNTVLTIYLRGDQQSKNFMEAARRLPLICVWLLTYFTFGIFATLFPKKVKTSRVLSGLNWPLATFLVGPVIMNEGGNIFRVMKRSSQLIHTQYGDHPRVNYSFSLIAIITRLAAFIPAFIGAISQKNFWIITGLIISGLLLFSLMVIHNALQTVFLEALYQHVSHKKFIYNFKDDVATALSS